jgi:hypothetical protein
LRAAIGPTLRVGRGRLGYPHSDGSNGTFLELSLDGGEPTPLRMALPADWRGRPLMTGLGR